MSLCSSIEEQLGIVPISIFMLDSCYFIGSISLPDGLSMSSSSTWLWYRLVSSFWLFCLLLQAMAGLLGCAFGHRGLLLLFARWFVAQFSYWSCHRAFCPEQTNCRSTILQQGPLQKGPETNENYNQAHQDPDVDRDEQNMPPARRRYSFPFDLDQKEPSCGREVDDPRPHGASILHRRRHRLEATEHHLQRQLRSGSAARRTPAEGSRTHQLQGASSAAQAADQQRSSTEHHHRRGNPPPQTTPTASPSPQRRRGKDQSNLHYIQTRPGVPPPSCRRSGRRREGEPTNPRRRGGSNGGAHKSPSLVL